MSTLSGSWTPLISNDSGSVSVAGATVHWGTWFYLVAGIAVLSVLVGVGLYAAGRPGRAAAARTAAPAAAR